MESSDPVYYKIMYWNKIDKMTVVCLQSFDEYDYDQKKFYKENGEQVRFSSEEDAVDFLNKRFKAEYIDQEYLSPNNEDFFKELEKDECDV